MYAELVELAHTAQMEQDFDPAGRFLKKTIRDRAYWYFRSAMTGSIRRDKYVGIDTPELAERIANHRSDKNDYKQRRTLVAALTALRTDAQPLRFLDFLIYQEVQAVALYGPGIPINVPAPERFALHKLIVSRLRIATAESQTKVR